MQSSPFRADGTAQLFPRLSSPYRTGHAGQCFRVLSSPFNPCPGRQCRTTYAAELVKGRLKRTDLQQPWPGSSSGVKPSPSTRTFNPKPKLELVCSSLGAFASGYVQSKEKRCLCAHMLVHLQPLKHEPQTDLNTSAVHANQIAATGLGHTLSPGLTVPLKTLPKASKVLQSCLGYSLAMCTSRGPRGLQAFTCSTMSASCGPV